MFILRNATTTTTTTTTSFPFGVLQPILPEAPQPYGLLYYPLIGRFNFLHQFRAATPPEQRNLEV
jgi:hypothetical protein